MRPSRVVWGSWLALVVVAAPTMFAATTTAPEGGAGKPRLLRGRWYGSTLLVVDAAA